MIKRFFLRSINEPELVDCPTCNSTGKIVGTLISDALEAPVKDTILSCPKCGGSGKIATGKVLHYTVSTVYIYGEATVNDDDKTQDYFLGFVCDDETMIEKYKEQNGITSFITFPGALRFYGKEVTLYDTVEEAEAAKVEAEANWTPELKLVNAES